MPNFDLRMASLRGPPGAPETGDSFTVRSPQGRRGLILPGLRMTPLLWASQELTKVVAVSQFAAPKGRGALFLVCA